MNVEITFQDFPIGLHPILTALGVDLSKFKPNQLLVDIVKDIDKDYKGWGFYRKLAINSILLAFHSESGAEDVLMYAAACLEIDCEPAEAKNYLNPFTAVRKFKEDRKKIEQAELAISYIEGLIEKSPEVEFKMYDLTQRIESSSPEEIKQFCYSMYDNMVSQENLYRKLIKTSWGI